MNEYVKEDELRAEIRNIQESKKLRELLSMKDESLNEEIQALKDKGATEYYSKERFGSMVLLMIQRITQKSNFAQYTWKDEFASNSIEKILTYAIENFDLDMVSKRTHKQTKAFAYLTSIINNAFLEVINNRKEEERMLMDRIVPFEDFYDYARQNYNPVYEHIEEAKEQPEIKVALKADEFDSVYEELKKLRVAYDKVELSYPATYSLSLDEYDKIGSLEFLYLNVNRESEEKYKPSFPKKQKLDKIDTFQEWV